MGQIFMHYYVYNARVWNNCGNLLSHKPNDSGIVYYCELYTGLQTGNVLRQFHKENSYCPVNNFHLTF